jgi:hypothetical protein
VARRPKAATELSDGFVYTLDTKGIALSEIAEWTTMERLCCPLLSDFCRLNFPHHKLRQFIFVD